MTPQVSLTIFYSWQSDLPFETNQRAIGGCIRNSILKAEENNEVLKLKYDEATRDEAGSPDIPATIFHKISSADIFICDITTINSIEATKRKTPNPNVLIELGFAIAELGWERIIMLFNKNYGDFASELPFDLDKRRVTNFAIRDKNDKSGKGDLQGKLLTSIELIVRKNPKKPLEHQARTIKREKDIATLTSLMACINIPTMDNFIYELPERVVKAIFFFSNSFQEIYDTAAFHLYDKDIAKFLKQFRIKWGKILEHGRMYHDLSDGKYYSFYVYTPNESSREIYAQIAKEANQLKILFKKIITFLRENYIEIDLDELSDKALQGYNDYEKGLTLVQP